MVAIGVLKAVEEIDQLIFRGLRGLRYLPRRGHRRDNVILVFGPFRVAYPAVARRRILSADDLRRYHVSEYVGVQIQLFWRALLDGDGLVGSHHMNKLASA